MANFNKMFHNRELDLTGGRKFKNYFLNHVYNNRTFKCEQIFEAGRTVFHLSIDKAKQM